MRHCHQQHRHNHHCWHSFHHPFQQYQRQHHHHPHEHHHHDHHNLQVGCEEPPPPYSDVVTECEASKISSEDFSAQAGEIKWIQRFCNHCIRAPGWWRDPISLSILFLSGSWGRSPIDKIVMIVIINISQSFIFSSLHGPCHGWDGSRTYFHRYSGGDLSLLALSISAMKKNRG